MSFRAPGLVVAALTAGAVLAATIGAADGAPRRHALPTATCHPRRRHRICHIHRKHARPAAESIVKHLGATVPRTPTTPTMATTPTTPTATSPTITTSNTTPPPLPSRLEVDENDQGSDPQPYSLRPSHDPVAAGNVQFNVYNFGQDPHTFAIKDASSHQLAFVKVPANQPDTAVPVSVRLSPGRYTLECTIQGHAGLGMRASLTVQ